MNYLIRRRKLGRTSCKQITAQSAARIATYRNDMRLPNAADYVFRWGCTTEVPNVVNIVNHPSAIHRVANKALFRQTLQEAELCPATWFKVEDVKYPCVVRPTVHHQGRWIWQANNERELRAAIAHPKCGANGWYASALIDKVAEYRVFVVCGRVVCVARKTPANPAALAWNVAQGGRFDNVGWDEWPLKAVRVSVEAFNLSKLDFGGVDVMVDAKGEVFVLEINAAPSLTSPYRQGCFAKAFDYIVKNGKEVIPLSKEKGGYTKFIHPAITRNAVMV